MFQVSPYLRRRWDLFQDHRLHGRDFGLLPEVQLPQETRWWPSELKLMTIDEIWLKRWRLMGCRLKSKWRKIKKKSRLVGGIPPPLKNMKVSCNIWKIKNVPNHQPVYIYIDWPASHVWYHWLKVYRTVEWSILHPWDARQSPRLRGVVARGRSFVMPTPQRKDVKWVYQSTS